MARRKRAPRRTDPTENADQAELAALRMGEAPISAGIIDEKLSGADDDYPRGNNALERDKALEEAEAEAATEIERRARLLGDAYPFRHVGSRLIHVPADPQLYELLLLVSLAEDYSTGRKRLLPHVRGAVVPDRRSLPGRRRGFLPHWLAPPTGQCNHA